jgi:hypothetical protein
MPESREKSGKGPQQDLFLDPLPGSSDDDSVTRGILTDAIKRSGMSREQIAEKMSYLTSRQISSTMLYDFTAESKAAHRFPFAWTRAFCQATGDMRLLQHIAEKLDFVLVAKDDTDVLTIGELVISREEADSKIARYSRNVIERRGRQA